MDFTSLGCSYALSVFSVGLQGLSACSAYASLACFQLPVLERVVGLSLRKFRGFGRVDDDRLQFMTRDDALNLDVALRNEDVSRAWDVWSSAAEAALADAYQFAGGCFLVRVVRLGGPEVRKARRNFADPQEGGDVFMYHDASAALLLDAVPAAGRFSAEPDVWTDGSLVDEKVSGASSAGAGCYPFRCSRLWANWRWAI